MTKARTTNRSQHSTKSASRKRPARRTQGARERAQTESRNGSAAQPQPDEERGNGGRGASDYKAQVRMYLQGLGDFFLLTLPRADGTPFRMLIDCGVIVGTPDAKGTMQDLVGKLATDVNKKLDVVVVTHRHADHVSGFSQAADIFKPFQVGEVWTSWVENPRDDLGKQLLSTHKKAERTLRQSAARLRMSGMAAAGDEVASLLGFRDVDLGAAGTGTTEDAVSAAKALGPLQFLRPDDPPRRIDGVPANFYVLGPPRDLKALSKMDPSKTNPETYGLTAMRLLLRDIAPALGADRGSDDTDQTDGGDDDGFDTTAQDRGQPFGAAWALPCDQNGGPEFLQASYFDSATAWRRIDQDWLAGASALALAFDQAVNNTSLVLAIELDSGEVLLFAADAQVGNWLSWQNLSWKIADRQISTADLLKRTVFYKVGHHASHNATLAKNGLESMQNLAYAMISVNECMAHKKRWGQMPFPDLLKALQSHTNGRSVRADQPIPPEAQAKVKKGNGYYELTL